MAEPTETATATAADAQGGEVREAVGLFDTPEALQQAVDELGLAGFAQHELSLMANDETLRAQPGGMHEQVRDAMHDPAVPRQALLQPEEVGNAQGVAIGVPAYVGAILATGAVVASGGTALAAVLAAATAAGAGGGLGAVLAGWLGRQRERTLAQHLEKGGLLLWVNLRDAERERVATEILARHVAAPVEVHTIPQVAPQVAAPMATQPVPPG